MNCYLYLTSCKWTRKERERERRKTFVYQGQLLYITKTKRNKVNDNNKIFSISNKLESILICDDMGRNRERDICSRDIDDIFNVSLRVKGSSINKE
jgi:hypothetical protein